jgi:hypothetical protein
MGDGLTQVVGASDLATENDRNVFGQEEPLDLLETAGKAWWQ